jgi:hypothetical protein
MYTLCSPTVFSIKSTKIPRPFAMCLVDAESIYQEFADGSAIIISMTAIAISLCV